MFFQKKKAYFIFALLLILLFLTACRSGTFSNYGQRFPSSGQDSDIYSIGNLPGSLGYGAVVSFEGEDYILDAVEGSGAIALRKARGDSQCGIGQQIGGTITPIGYDGQDGSGIYEVDIDGTTHRFEAKIGTEEAPNSIWIYTEEQGTINDFDFSDEPIVTTYVSPVLTNGANKNGRHEVRIKVNARRKLIGIHAIMPPRVYIIKDSLDITSNVKCIKRDEKCKGDFEITATSGQDYINEVIQFEIFDESSCIEKVTTYWTAPGPVSSEGNIIVEHGRERKED